MEVFLSLVERQVRDGNKSGSGKSKLKETTIDYRRLIMKHYDCYKEYTSYVPPKLTHAQQSADYECTKIITAYINNIKAHFGNRLRQVLNLICKKQIKSNEIRQKMSKARYSEESIKQVIKETVTTPCANVKISVSRKQQPNESFLSETANDLIKSILATYPKTYTFQKSSIYYDVQASPLNHFKTFHLLGKLLQSLTLDKENNTFKSFVVYPLRTSHIPAHITIDSLMMNFHILGSKKASYQKHAVWEEILNMKYRALKKQKIDKSLCFQGTMLTDGVNVTILKQNFESGRGPKQNTLRQSSDLEQSGSSKGKKSKTRKSNKTINDDEFTYIENLTMEQLRETKERCVLIDPNRRDVLYCMKETSRSTPNQKNIFRFTQNQRNKKSRRLKYLRNRLKPESIKSAESLLSKCPSSTLDLEKFINYLKTKRLVETQLKSYYANETLTVDPLVYYNDPLDFVVEVTGDVYYGRRLLFIKRIDNSSPGIADLHTYIQFLTLLMSVKNLTQRLTNTDIDNLNELVESTTIWLDENEASEDELTNKKNEVKRQAHAILSKLLLLPFRRLKLVSKIYHDKCDVKLAKDLKKHFGKDTILVVGDWSAPTVKFHEPIRNKGLLKFLKKAGFTIYHINEFKTSSCCPFCLEGELEKYKEVQNPRPYQRKNSPTVICNGLLR